MKTLTLKKTFLKEHYTINFGKYKGKKVREVISLSPSYILWCENNFEGVNFEASVIKQCEEKLSNEFPIIPQDLFNN